MFTFLAISAMIVAGACNNNDEPAERQGRTIAPDHTVTIYDGEQEVASVNVALAVTEDQRNAGLMDVHDMPFDTGMLFLFDDEQPRSFWMANTPLSLDIIFLNSQSEIVRIQANTTPYSDRQVSSGVPARYVLEVNAGFSREYDIREGMRIEWTES